MTFRRLAALRRHWRQHPRVEWLVAGYLKYKAPVESKKAKDSGLRDLVARFGLTPGKKVSG